jgi:hypothetical protein
LDKKEMERAVYTSYKIETDYRTQQNSVQLPIAASVKASSSGGALKRGQPTAFVVTMAPPTTKRVLLVTASCLGNWPKLPKHKPASIGGVDVQVIGEAQIVARTPTLLNDGQTRMYEIRAEYEYSLSRPMADNENLVLGKIPWDSSKASDNFIPHDIFETDLISDKIATA